MRRGSRVNGPPDSGSRAFSCSCAPEGLDAVFARDAFAFVAEDHRVAVEGDAQLLVVCASRARARASMRGLSISLACAGRMVAAAMPASSARRTDSGFADRNSCAPKGLM